MGRVDSTCAWSVEACEFGGADDRVLEDARVDLVG